VLERDERADMYAYVVALDDEIVRVILEVVSRHVVLLLR
jgi:hypothetical protein